MSKEISLDDYEYVHYLYESTETKLFESTVIIKELEFASVASLEKEVFNQYSFLYFPEDNTEELLEEGKLIEKLVGRTEMLVCNEGVYSWDTYKEKYEHMGRIKDTKKVRRIEVPEDKVTIAGDDIHLIKKGHYDIIDEQQEVINKEFTIGKFTIFLGKGILQPQNIEILNHPGVYKVYEVDLALIDYENL